MRLIRLTTKDLTGYVDADFNEDIILEPKSKIALHSLTSQFNRFELNINAQNDKITFSVDGDGAIKILSLPNGIWNNASMLDFFTLATQAFNQTMEYTTNQLGRQWYVGTAEDRFTFQCMPGTVFNPAQSTNPTYAKFIRTQNVTNAGTGSPFIWRRTTSGGTSGTNDAFVYYKSTQCKGSASFRSKLISDPAPDTEGFVLAYSLSSVSEQTTVIDESSIAFGIRYVDLGQPYKKIINGVETATTTTPLMNDILAIDTYQNLLRLRVYRSDSPNPITLHSVKYDHITNYFPIAIFVGTTRIGGIQFSSDYFYNVKNPPTEVDSTYSLDVIPTFSSKVITDNFLEFDDPLLAQELGFKQYRYPLTGYNREVNVIYTGENGFKLRDFSESYIIEMLNLNIDSYDSMTKQHKNFLAVVPSVSQVREQVVYMAPNLIWLDINNAFPLIMRQFKARVLKEDLTAINTYGLTQITIIIKGPNE
jgi:hypothetical protein